MARGKYSARAVQQARDERDSGLRQAQRELAAVIRRAEIAEARAALIPNLEKRISDLLEQQANDEVLKELAAAISAWRDAAEVNAKAMSEYREAWTDAVRDVCKLTGMIGIKGKNPDAVEYIQRRWPHLLRDGDGPGSVVKLGIPQRAKHRLSDDAIRRLQAIRGMRLSSPGMPGEDFSEALVKLLDDQAVEETAQ